MSSKALAVALLLAAAPVSATVLMPATLIVKVENVSAKGGNLRLGVYNRAQFEVRGTKPAAGAVVPAKAGEMVLTFSDLAPGEYGVKTFQDENANGTLDMFLGLAPSEPFGVSNDARPRGGPASWDDAKFTLKPGVTTIVIHLH